MVQVTTAGHFLPTAVSGGGVLKHLELIWVREGKESENKVSAKDKIWKNLASSKGEFYACFLTFHLTLLTTGTKCLLSERSLTLHGKQ